jgi:MEDS: MEthanogen/methylotroph, DcmR Sensory domain
MQEEVFRGETISSMIGGAPSATGNCATWESVLEAPAEGQHVAQLYTEPNFLVRAVCRFVVAGLRQGEAVLLLIRATHRPAIVRHLEADGFVIDDLSHRGQLTILDATRTLTELLVHGRPERARVQAVVGGAVEARMAAGYTRFRAFGEMVDILRRASLTMALQLEGLWTELVTARRIALLCGYSIDTFNPEAYRGLLQRVSAAHSHVVPVEDYARLDHAVESAYLEVFGVGRDAGFLRRTFIANYPRPATMPDAQAAILAAQEFVPEAAVALLDRIRHHYHGPTAA